MGKKISKTDKQKIVKDLLEIKNNVHFEPTYKCIGFRLLLEETMQKYLNLEQGYYKLDVYLNIIENHPVLRIKKIQTRFKVLYNFFGSHLHPNIKDENQLKLDLEKYFEKLIDFFEIVLEIKIDKNIIDNLDNNHKQSYYNKEDSTNNLFKYFLYTQILNSNKPYGLFNYFFPKSHLTIQLEKRIEEIRKVLINENSDYPNGDGKP